MKRPFHLLFVFIFFWFLGVSELHAFEVTFVGKTIEITKIEGKYPEQTAYITLLSDQNTAADLELSLENDDNNLKITDLKRWLYLEKDKLTLPAGYQHRLVIFVKPKNDLPSGLYKVWIKVQASNLEKKRSIRIPLWVALLPGS